MEIRRFGQIGSISALTLGGGGIGQVWGTTDRQEAVATVRAAVDAGINWLDMAPLYGNGEAESVVGEAFNGSLPAGVRVSTKHFVGNAPPAEVPANIDRSLTESLARMKLQRVDLFVLHGMICPDDVENPRAVRRSVFEQHVRPAFEALVASGRVGAWGITAVGYPDAIIETLNASPAPAAAQCVTNLLGSAGSMWRIEGNFDAAAILRAATANDVGVMGIRAVQAGALTSGIDRQLPDDHPEMLDFRRAAPFRALARELGESPASLAHRYALSMPGVSTVILGVKNRTELAECVAAAESGPLTPQLMARIDTRLAQ